MAREMKDSGIEWIGKIPQKWDIKKGKWILKLLERPITETDGVITCFRNGEVTLRSKRREEGFTISLKEIGYQGVDEGDLVVHGMDGFAGAIGISDSRGKGSPVLNVLGSDQCKKYIMYYLRSMAYNGIFLALSTGIRVRSCDTNWNKLKELLYILPKTSEQQLIANFLDTRCAHIDSVIEKTRAAIEEYKKLKQSVITQAVTKGIRPNREMKDSGIEWIGKTPEEWNILKIKYLFTIKKDVAGEEGYQVLSITQRGIKPKDLSKNEGQLAANYSNYQIVSIGDFAMNHMDLLTGWVDVSNYYGVTSPDYRVFRLLDIEKNSSRYYLYLMQLCYFNRVFYGLGQGVSGMGRWRLQADKFLNMYIVNPPIDEQSEIVAYLDEKTAAIDSLIQKKEQLITELEAYKKSLIYEYVTGKKEVPHSKPRIKYTIEFKMALLMCRILQYTNIEGRVHMQKVIYSSDTLLNLFNEIQYYRFQKGPYDINIERYEHSLVQHGWVKVYKKRGKVIYKKTSDFNKYTSFYKNVFSEMDLEIKRICQLFNVLSTAQAGKTATVVASWNDFLIDGVTPTDEMIVNDIVTNWTANKANIPRKTWFDTLEQIKSKGLVPKGFGKKTLHLEEAKHAH